MGEVGEPLKQLKADFSSQESYALYVDWHNGERINVNELTGLDRDLVLMGVPVDELEEAKLGVECLAKTGVNYREALITLRSISVLGSGTSIAESVLNNLGRLP
jgi:hypothetical protein